MQKAYGGDSESLVLAMRYTKGLPTIWPQQLLGDGRLLFSEKLWRAAAARDCVIIIRVARGGR